MTNPEVHYDRMDAPTCTQAIEEIVERLKRGETFSTRLTYDWVVESDIERIWSLLPDGVEPLIGNLTQGGDTFYVFNPPAPTR